MKERISRVAQQFKGYDNVTCKVLPGGHEWQGKGNAIVKFFREYANQKLKINEKNINSNLSEQSLEI